MSHTYHFPNLWNEKAHDAIVSERHDITLLFDATNCNPNGDPDTGNMPRIQPDTLRGLITDVSQKRKLRNFFALHYPNGEPKAEGAEVDTDSRYSVFIRENAVIETSLNAGIIKHRANQLFRIWLESDSINEAKRTEIRNSVQEEVFEGENYDFDLDKLKPRSDLKGDPKKEAIKLAKELSKQSDRFYRDALAQIYFDIRFFGAVVSTEGPLKGSFYGQIRGPLQITFAESLDKILQLDFSITRCAVANEKEAEAKGDDNRTMGRKHTVPYGLYRSHIHFSPAFAAKTGFTYADLDNFLFALTQCFGDYNVDGSSARPGGMRVVGLVDFEHNSSLGNAPAHKLFNLVQVNGIKTRDGNTEVFKSSGSEFPQGLQDYHGSAPDGEVFVKKNSYGVVEAVSNERPENQTGNEAPIRARRLIWEISEQKQEQEQPA